MAKKKKTKIKRFRNRSTPRRNAASIAPAVARAPRARASTAGGTSLNRLGYTAAGAAGTALVGAMLARQGWAPKTVASALTAVGAGLAWKGDSSAVQSLGNGAMSAGGGQLAMLLIDEHQVKTDTKKEPVKKPSNAESVPPGSLESAFERARSRLSMTSGEAD